VDSYVPNCANCASRMVRMGNPFGRIFGDVREFGCSACGFVMILPFPYKPMSFHQPAEPNLEAAE
jgi:hypothetical protein